MKNQVLRNMSVAIATLFIVMFAMPFMAKAQTEYNLEIAGVQVTSENCDDLSVIDGVSGTVEYNPDTKTLTLEDATIEVGGNNKRCIESGVENLTIVVKGTCNLSTAKAAIFLRENTTITGGGTLSLASAYDCGIYLKNTPLTIDGCRVEAKGEWGIAGKDGENGEHLTIKNATVTAEGSKGSICDLASLTLEGCKITEPVGAAFNKGAHAVCDADGNIIKSKIVIKPTEAVTEYKLKIAGVKVTSENCNDLSVIDGVSGTVEYNPDTNTLTLEDAMIEIEGICIESEVENLTIVVKGTCSLSSHGTSVSIYKNTTITGGGTLSLASAYDVGIYLKDTHLTIDGCRVEAKGNWGIAGYDGESGEHLTIKNATVTAEGTEGSICDLASLTLEGCGITEPAGATFNEGKHAVCDASGNITNKIVIKPTVKYNLKIAGVQVT
ncbi:carbohydrate-binding domain-containing protein, partial [Porphyromonas circumdentaria]|uniref:carbohydrate-binding domain-containing protein n=1 Tax=Porphyromonas circumdentaria TaxID=29524 RepID=UPI001832822A